MPTSEFELREAGTWDEAKQTEVDTVCPYCGVGCNLTLHVQDDAIVKVTSPRRPRRDARQPLRQGPLRLPVRPEPRSDGPLPDPVLAGRAVASSRRSPTTASAVKRQLPDWFQQEIDRRAMEQGLVGSDAYLEQWRWGDVEERAGTPDEVLDAVERELTP